VRAIGAASAAHGGHPPCPECLAAGGGRGVHARRRSRLRPTMAQSLWPRHRRCGRRNLPPRASPSTRAAPGPLPWPLANAPSPPTHAHTRPAPIPQNPTPHPSRKPRPARLDAIRFLNASIKQREIELRATGGALGDAEVIATIQKLAKQRRDSIESYEKGGRSRWEAGRSRGCAAQPGAGAAGASAGRLGRGRLGAL
jgi:hypothetical protein